MNVKLLLFCVTLCTLSMHEIVYAAKYEARNQASKKHLSSIKRHLAARAKDVPKHRAKSFVKIQCLAIKGKSNRKLQSNQCRRTRFKVVTLGHALAQHVTGGPLVMPRGWLSIKSAHSKDELCINIFTGELCDKNRSFGEILGAPPSVNDSLVVSQPDTEDNSEQVVMTESSEDGSLDNGTTTFPDNGDPSFLAYAMDPQPSMTKILSEKETSLQETEPSASATNSTTEKMLAGIVTTPYTKDITVDEDIIHPTAQAAIDLLFRDRKTGHIKGVNPRLIIKLASISEHFRKQIHLVSGYRNQLHVTSRHYGARASDIQIPGVSIDQIRDFVQRGNPKAIGIGLYPKSGFIHVDVRDNPSYLWVETIVPIKRAKQRRGHSPQRGTQRTVASKSGVSRRRSS